MNTTASFLPEPSWSRRCSTETVFSIQGRETDFVQDSSDSELDSDDEDVEYEPATDTDEEPPISEASSGQSDDELKTKQVVSVSCGEGDLQLADSEWSNASDADLGRHAARYAACARCHVANDNPRYRYCLNCFKLRKTFFPPRPRRKGKSEATQDPLPSSSQDSGIDSLHSQEASDDVRSPSSSQEVGRDDADLDQPDELTRLGKLKRRSESEDRSYKRPRLESESDNEASRDVQVAPLVKTVSDPGVTIETLETNSKDNLCIICYSEPKSGVFVHRRVAHICCCYNCAVKVWSKARRCPICNCKVSNVLKAVVM